MLDCHAWADHVHALSQGFDPVQIQIILEALCNLVRGALDSAPILVAAKQRCAAVELRPRLGGLGFSNGFIIAFSRAFDTLVDEQGLGAVRLGSVCLSYPMKANMCL